MVKANRRIRDGLIQRLGSLLYVAECRSLFDLPYWDINGTPKVFPRTLSKLLALKSHDELVDLEFDVVCRREGYEVMEVPLTSASAPTMSPALPICFQPGVCTSEPIVCGGKCERRRPLLPQGTGRSAANPLLVEAQPTGMLP